MMRDNTCAVCDRVVKVEEKYVRLTCRTTPNRFQRLAVGTENVSEKRRELLWLVQTGGCVIENRSTCDHSMWRALRVGMTTTLKHLESTVERGVRNCGDKRVSGQL